MSRRQGLGQRYGRNARNAIERQHNIIARSNARLAAKEFARAERLRMAKPRPTQHGEADR
jgi:hypothetical protein